MPILQGGHRDWDPVPFKLNLPVYAPSLMGLQHRAEGVPGAAISLHLVYLKCMTN